jgi:eukaryotic-like serine/threonine-protein kinase
MLLGGKLPEAESESLRAHIDGCEACASVVAAVMRGRRSQPALAWQQPVQAAIGIGTRLGRYELRRLLGSGGMGQVFAAYDTELSREVAIKVLRPQLANADPVHADRLVRESRMMAKVVHPSVVTVFDAGRDGDRVFVAMELVHGETLAAYLARVKLGWREILEIFERAGAGLAAAHRAGIVHRDFKLDNILVESKGGVVSRVVVTDFGIARMVDEAPLSAADEANYVKLTQDGAAIGTPAYMPPEQIAGKAVDHRADVFAFCVSLWEAVFGERPFRGRTLAEIREAFAGPPPTPRAERRGVMRFLVRVLRRGLAIDPRDRWPDIESLLPHLRATRLRHKRMAIAAGAAGLLACAGVGAFALARSGSTNPCAAELRYDAVALVGTVRSPTALSDIRDNAARWRDVHDRTCVAERTPPQDPLTTACLASRKLEIVSAVEESIAFHGEHAGSLAGEIDDPSRCEHPTASISTARVPVDPALRHRVAELRIGEAEVVDMRAKGEGAAELAKIKGLVEASKSVWPPLYSELLHQLGATYMTSGNHQEAQKAFRESAAIAESHHFDRIAVGSWLSLAQIETSDEGDPARALEYVQYGEAALDRAGRLGTHEAMFLYVKGSALVELGRSSEAEVALKKSLELANQHAPEYVVTITTGLAYIYDAEARFAEAVATYRQALAALTRDPTATPGTEINLRQGMAESLSRIRQFDDAQREARQAIALAERSLSEDNLDRHILWATLAGIQERAGKLDDALTSIERAKHGVAKLLGMRSLPYGRVLTREASIQHSRGDLKAAVESGARACDVLESQLGAQAQIVATCWLEQAILLEDIERSKEALELADRALPILSQSFDDKHPTIGSLHSVRSSALQRLGRIDEAIASAEQRLAVFEVAQVDPGNLASSRWRLAGLLWKRDNARARELLAGALAVFEKAEPDWANEWAEARAWNASHPK